MCADQNSGDNFSAVGLALLRQRLVDADARRDVSIVAAHSKVAEWKLRRLVESAQHVSIFTLAELSAVYKTLKSYTDARTVIEPWDTPLETPAAE